MARRASHLRYSPLFSGDESVKVDPCAAEDADADVDDFLPRLQTLSEKFRLVFVLFKVLTKSSSVSSQEVRRKEGGGGATPSVPLYAPQSSSFSPVAPMLSTQTVLPESLLVVDFSLDSKYIERVLLHAQFALLEPERYANFASVQELMYRTQMATMSKEKVILNAVAQTKGRMSKAPSLTASIVDDVKELRQKKRELRRLKRLFVELEQRLDKFTVQALANMAWAFATAGQ